MGKKKSTLKESEDEDYLITNSKSDGISNRKLSEVNENSRPRAGCSALLFFVFLVGSLSILTGLVLIELNDSKSDSNSSYSSWEKEPSNKFNEPPNTKVKFEADPEVIKLPNIKMAEKVNIKSRGEAVKPTIEPTTNKLKEEKTEEKVTKETKPSTKETKPSTKETKPSTKETKPSTKETKPSTKETKPSTKETKPSTKETKPSTKETIPSTKETKPSPKDTKPSPKETKPLPKETEPSTKETKTSSEETISKPKLAAKIDQIEKEIVSDRPKSPEKEESTETDKDVEFSLKDLYLEVESLAEDILMEDPENEMVQNLAPHFEGVLKNLEGKKFKGLRDSLLHIKLILIDLKERLDEEKMAKASEPKTDKLPHNSKDATSSTPTKEGERVPVEEVIPDPVYIAPRGDEDKETPKKEGDQRHLPSKDKLDQRVPVNEVIPDPVYIAPLGEDEKSKKGEEQKPKVAEQEKTKVTKQENPKETNQEKEKITDPVKPKVADRVKPKVAEPVKPKVAEPVKPKDTAPVKPKEAESVNPKDAEPVKLKEAVSVKPKVAEQVKPKDMKQDDVPPKNVPGQVKQESEPKIADDKEPLLQKDTKQSKSNPQMEKKNEKPVPKKETKTEQKDTKASSKSKVDSSASKPVEKEVLDADTEDRLNLAESIVDKHPLDALNIFGALAQEKPKSLRILLGRAKSLEIVTEKEKSNVRLAQTIYAYRNIIDLADESPSLVPIEVLKEAGIKCVEKMKFRGLRSKAIRVLDRLLVHFPDDKLFLNKKGVVYLQMNQNEAAVKVFEHVLKIAPNDGFAMAHYGLGLKFENLNMTEAIKYIEKGIESEDHGTQDNRFYYHLGDMLQRLGQNERAYKLYDKGVKKGLFLSRYQRSLYNIKRLTSKPIWNTKDTPYKNFFSKVESRWKDILKEAMAVISLRNQSVPGLGFSPEAENLTNMGEWGQFNLFKKGKKNEKNCKFAPITCSLVDHFPPAANCTRGQTKFSLMEGGTHVYPHTGPTNCRLRSHLGLVIPEGPLMRVTNKTLKWTEGKVILFDDSFEHEVWHKGTSFRLILIIDLWHPEVTSKERNSLPPI